MFGARSLRIETFPFGYYVHIPFCAHRCDYCDFATWSDREHLVDAYVAACVQQLRTEPSLPVATSVFFGGGTPSLIEASALVSILDEIPRASDCETTVECNPDRVDANKFQQYAAAGVNRVSLGVQSTATHVLNFLGRTHEPSNVDRAVAWARDAGIVNVNLDVIYGTPGESIDNWIQTLHDVVALNPTHVSAYALTVEPGTPLGARVRDQVSDAPDDDDQARKYEIAGEILGAHGYLPYEISNWSLPGRECRHNQLYWSMGEYLAIGCAAHGHRDGERFWNVRTPERFIDAVSAGTTPLAGSERLTPAQRAEESFVLALRMREGCAIAEPAHAAWRCIDELCTAGLLWHRDGRVGLASAGRLLANDITSRLVLAGVSTR